jgi:hypothetical protein
MGYSDEPTLERLLKLSQSLSAQVDLLDQQIEHLLARTAQLMHDTSINGFGREEAASCNVPAGYE